MQFVQLDYDRNIDLGSAIQDAIGSYYVRFLEKTNNGDILYKVYNGYAIYDGLKKNLWYLYKDKKNDTDEAIKEYANKQWDRLMEQNNSKKVYNNSNVLSQHIKRLNNLTFSLSSDTKLVKQCEKHINAIRELSGKINEAMKKKSPNIDMLPDLYAKLREEKRYLMKYYREYFNSKFSLKYHTYNYDTTNIKFKKLSEIKPKELTEIYNTFGKNLQKLVGMRLKKSVQIGYSKSDKDSESENKDILYVKITFPETNNIDRNVKFYDDVAKLDKNINVIGIRLGNLKENEDKDAKDRKYTFTAILEFKSKNENYLFSDKEEKSIDSLIEEFLIR